MAVCLLTVSVCVCVFGAWFSITISAAIVCDEAVKAPKDTLPDTLSCVRHKNKHMSGNEIKTGKCTTANGWC